MKCKLHPDANAVGVCAPCLRDRLVAVAAERDQHAAAGSDADTSCGSSPRSLPLPARRRQHLQRDRARGFPRSVSPYVAAAHRRSDACAPSAHQPGLLFFRTPQVGPAAGGCRADDDGEPPGEEKAARRRRSFLAAIFGGGHRRGRDEEEKVKDPPRRSTSWLSAIVRRKRRPDAATASFPRAPHRDEEEAPESSSPGASSNSTSWWLPSPSPGRQQHRRRHGTSGDGISGFAVCLSPLVRPSSAGGGRRRCQPPDPASLSQGDSHRRHASAGGAASFGRNTSRKLADMSRFR